MEAREIDGVAESPWPGSDLEWWGDMMGSACAAIGGTSPGLMTSVAVMGKLDGIERAAPLITMLSKRLAAENNLQATVQQEEWVLTVRFSRCTGADSGSPSTSRNRRLDNDRLEASRIAR